MKVGSMELFHLRERQTKKRERILNKVERENKEDFLLSQIDEFREKAKHLQELILSKENKVQELQEQVEEQEAVEKVMSSVGPQMDALVDKFDAKMKEMNETFAERLAENAVNVQEQNDAMKKLMEKQETVITETVQKMNEQIDGLKNEISEKVHTESVKNYRNVQTLLDEAEKKNEEMRVTVESLAGVGKVAKVSVILSLLNLIALVAILLNVLGVV